MRAQLARVDAILVQAVIAAALSFAHLHDLASAAGQDGWKAWAYPVSVDLLLVAAWRRLRSGRDKAAGWCWFLVALAASLGANISTAGLLDLDDVPDWLRILVAGWPALAFLGGTLLAHGSNEPALTEHSEPAEVPEQEPTVSVERAVPEEPTPISSDPAPSAPPVPAALVAHARKVADAHQARTGAPIDTDTLRARLGVPAPLADRIAAQLT
ncbi:SpdA protein [Streptomyces nanshensis]|nr:SpdA protein [Streptomyces nanshensis]